MGGLMAVLSAIRDWGRHAPHISSHADCSCTNASSSSEEAERDLRKTTTWLQRHRDSATDAKEPGAAAPRRPSHQKANKPHGKK